MTQDNGRRNSKNKSSEQMVPVSPKPHARAPRLAAGRDFLKRNLLALLHPLRKPVTNPVN